MTASFCQIIIRRAQNSNIIQEAHKKEFLLKIIERIAKLDNIPAELQEDPFFKENICPITFEPIRFAVCTVTNPKISYEKEPLESWVRKNQTDPYTQESLNIDQIHPCIELQAKIDQKLREYFEHTWLDEVHMM